MTTRDLPLLGRWIAARVRMMLRSPRALGFTFAFPLVLVTLFGSLNADQKVTAPSGAIVKFTQYYTPSIGVFALTLACYTSLIIGVATARETGLLKRVRGTPLPLPVYLGAWLIGAGVVGILSVVLLFVVAVPAFGVHVYADTLPQALLVLVLGAACLGSIGLALGTMAKTADQATPLAQLTMLPISFISGVWFPITDAPSWLVHLAGFFPLKHLVDAFSACFVPGGSIDGADLGSLAAWGAVAMLVAVRRLRAFGESGGRSRLIPSFR
jgi:ABC-2 type transport system permease protein